MLHLQGVHYYVDGEKETAIPNAAQVEADRRAEALRVELRQDRPAALFWAADPKDDMPYGVATYTKPAARAYWRADYSTSF